MLNGFALFYKDKDGYECPIRSDFLIVQIYASERQAIRGLADTKERIDNLLNPVKEIKLVRKGIFGPKVPEHIERPVLPDYVQHDLRQQFNTAFVKAVRVI
ncbi:hypothetical protein Acj9p024 [Acinetobacter phage Acj9]|uniref:Uncharacterized protein n=1 Tax=Acinetobacter phage Acj9 TaxID=760939 RepID=E5EPF8_9CAUD|nr:hypothetical protein Acj9p024 [Acinetobacter phage Acj9]ADG59924.1 hypothetical protein Acj9p024 [Acinetobacter phage Acj9]